MAAETARTAPGARGDRPGRPCGCDDYDRSRRRFLQAAGGLAVGAGLTSTFGSTFVQTTFASDGAPSSGRVLVVLSLRGGADGLSLVVPHADQAYYDARPTIAVPRSTLVAASSQFGLHPGFAPLAPLWQAGRMGAVSAVGLPAPNRSHFAAMEAVEDADPGTEARTGWINRLIGLDTVRSPLQAVQVGDPVVPTSLFGPQPVLAADRLDSAVVRSPDWSADFSRARRRSLERTWSAAGGPLGRAGRAALGASDRLGPVVTSAYEPRNGARYPATDLGEALLDTARLVRGGLGVEVVTVDFGGWDMHAALGDVGAEGQESMAGMVRTLAEALAAFHADLADADVTTVVLTEFGRRLAQNGARGLDHGWGSTMLLLGSDVRGGYHGRWPGLGPDDLRDGDVPVTTDYRSVLAEVVENRFGSDVSAVFPGFRRETVGAVVAR